MDSQVIESVSPEMDGVFARRDPGADGALDTRGAFPKGEFPLGVIEFRLNGESLAHLWGFCN